MFRHEFALVLLGLLLVLCSGGAKLTLAQRATNRPSLRPTTAAVTKDSRPNFIILLTDDLGYGEVNAHNDTWGFPTNPLAADGYKPYVRPPGFTVMETPNLARMASQGIRAMMSYSPSSICAPSRASIFLERHVGVINCIRGNKLAETNEMITPVNTTNFVQELQTSGYTTAFFGKWGLGVVQGAPWNQGFDYYAGQLYHVEAHTFFPDSYFNYDPKLSDGSAARRPQTVSEIARLKVPIPVNAENTWDDTNCALDESSACVHINDIMMDKAMRFLEEQTGKNQVKPFLLFLSPTYPHAGKYNTADKTSIRIAPVKHITQSRINQKPSIMRGHASQIEEHMDKDVGKILDFLEARPEVDANTFFIFTSDNGANLEKPFDQSIFDPTNGLRGAKRNLYEGGIRVPTILRWPGTLRAGTISLLPFALYDLGPTLREIAGLKPAPDALPSGKPTLVASMFKAWRDGDENSVLAKRQFLQFEMCVTPGNEYECARAIVDMRQWNTANGKLFKLIQFSGKAKRTELYDLRQSPKEQTPIRNNRGKVLELLAIHKAHRNKFRNKCVFAPP